MNRRHVLQTLAVLSAGSTTIAAFGETSITPLTEAVQRNLSDTLRESQKLCNDLLNRLDRVESRNDLFSGVNSTANKAAGHALQESFVLLEQAEARAVAMEPRAVALFQACADSLLRVETSLNFLCQQGTLPRTIVDPSVTVFRQARRLLSNLPVA